MLAGILDVVAWLFIFHTLFLTFQLITARVLGFAHGEAVVGVGPELWRGSLGPIDLRFKFLPLFSYVTMPHLQEDAPREGTARQVVLFLAPWAAILVVAALVLGPGGVIASAKNTGYQLLTGVYPSFGGGAPLLRRTLASLTDAPLQTLASLTVKLAIFNILPLPSLAGGRAVLLLLRVPNRVGNVLAALSSLAFIPFGIGWGCSYYQLVFG
jgi:membrane-associated protease RseP (regulator of RpoE activity)